MNQESDRELGKLLLRLQQDEDEASLRRIIDLTWEDVLLLSRRLVCDQAAAEDLTQDVFLVFCRRFSTIRDPYRLRSWLHGVAVRKAREHRPNPREPLLDPKVLQFLCDSHYKEEGPFEIVTRGEELIQREAALRKACAALSPRLRTCVELICVERCSRPEAAARMGVSVETIWQYLSRAVAQIAKNIKKGTKI